MLQLAAFAGPVAALFLGVPALQWWKVSSEEEPHDQAPVLGVRRVRSAAFATVMAFFALAIAVAATVLAVDV